MCIRDRYVSPRYRAGGFAAAASRHSTSRGQARHAVISAASAESAAAGIKPGSSCTARSYRTLLDPRVPPRRLAPEPPLGRPSGCSRGLGYNRATRAGDGATQGGHDPPVGRSRNLRPADQGTHSDMTVETSTWATKKGLAQMLKGGVIMDVVTPDHAKIAEDAGAVAVMALERVPSDIRATGAVSYTHLTLPTKRIV